MGGEGRRLRDDLILVHRSFLSYSQKTSVLVSHNCPVLIICQVTGHTDSYLGLKIQCLLQSRKGELNPLFLSQPRLSILLLEE